MPEKAPDVVVSEVVDAPVAEVWELVGDPARIVEICWSATRSVGSAAPTGPPSGARFIGWNRKGLLRWPTTSTVAEYESEQPPHQLGRRRRRPVRGALELHAHAGGQGTTR